MATDTVEALCGKCKVPIDAPANAKPQDTGTCPRCGRHDTIKNILREVGEHAKEVMARGYQKALRSGLRGSKSIKVSGKPVSKRSYRFISNLKN